MNDRKMIFRLLAGAACLLWAIPATAVATGADIVPRKLTCEYRTNPSVVDAEHPRLSWINEAVSGRRGASQKAWQIRVASSEEGDCCPVRPICGTAAR